MLTLHAPRATARLRLNVKGFNMGDRSPWQSFKGGESGRPSRSTPRWASHGVSCRRVFPWTRGLAAHPSGEVLTNAISRRGEGSCPLPAEYSKQSSRPEKGDCGCERAQRVGPRTKKVFLAPVPEFPLALPVLRLPPVPASRLVLLPAPTPRNAPPSPTPTAPASPRPLPPRRLVLVRSHRAG